MATASYSSSAAEVTIAVANNALAYADLKYSFYISGPAKTVVPVTFSGVLTGVGGSSFIGVGGTEGVDVRAGVDNAF